MDIFMDIHIHGKPENNRPQCKYAICLLSKKNQIYVRLMRILS